MTDSPVFWAEGDDPELRRASQRARATFRYFWRELSWEARRIVPGLSVAAFKAAFSDQGVASRGTSGPVEHMWVGEVGFDGLTLRGVLINQPDQLTRLKQGDAVEVPLGQLEDWLYAMDDRAYGAFTVNVLRARMSPEERRAHDGAWGLDFGDPSQEQLLPAPRSKPGALKRLFGRQPEPVADLEAEHPMSVNMEQTLREALRQDRGLLDGTDDHGLNLLHQLALGGSEAGVRVALESGADVSVRTSAGLTAHQLAASLGWPRVVALLERAGPSA
jgi:uncharacterized protein